MGPVAAAPRCYKAREQGKHLVKIDPWFASSKACHVCQHKMDAMPLSVRSWECPACHAPREIEKIAEAA